MLKLQSNKTFPQYCKVHGIDVMWAFGSFAKNKEWLKPIDFNNDAKTPSLYLPNNKWGYFIGSENFCIVPISTPYVADSDFCISLDAYALFNGIIIESKWFDTIVVPMKDASNIPNLPETKVLVAKIMAYLKRASYGLEGCHTKEEVLKFVKSLG